MNVVANGKLSTRAKIVGTFGIGFGFFAGAGVTGLSLVIGCVGVWALLYGVMSKERPLLTALKTSLVRHGLVWVSFVAFVVWAMVSATWSPAHKLAGESVRRLAAMLVFAPLAAWGCASAFAQDRLIARHGLIACISIALFILLFEGITDAAINKIASPEKDPLAIAGDLGRAATATLCLFWAAFAAMKRDTFDTKMILALVAICGFLAFQFGTDLNAVGLVLGSCAALLALSFPRLAIGILTGTSAVIMMSAPLLYPLLTRLAVSVVPNGHLPMSYGRRAQMWNFAADLIAQKPLTGWGIGAGSTFDKVIQFEGFPWPQIQLHPHAAPLHIWLETGAVGATLAAIAIIAAGGAAIRTFGRHEAAASALVGGMTFLALQWGFSHAAWREWMWTSFAAVIIFSLAVRDFRPKQRESHLPSYEEADL
jgi:O-antigen ligase